MKLKSIFKTSMLALIAAGLIAIAPVQNTVFAKNTVNSEITKKHKHKHKHGKKKTTTTTKDNKSSNTGDNKSKDNKPENKGNSTTKTNKKQ